MINDYYTIKEAAKEWGLTERWVRTLCSQNRIPGAVQFGRVWAIPQNAERPVDRRITTGKYKDWRRDKKKIRTEMVQEDENGYSE
jgi:hypothetical protein